MKTLQMYYKCWLEVTKQRRYQDKWLTDETYYRAIKAQFPTSDFSCSCSQLPLWFLLVGVCSLFGLFMMID
jgi:hypothetical protein